MAYEVPINKAEIRTLIPHSGLMCLLDEVTQWDDGSITCVTNTHRDSANPLRRGGRLSVGHPAIWLLYATRVCMWYFWMTLDRRCRSVQTACSVTVPTQFMNAAF
jgi:predicted hotdog family 3-hydroxylacyl-ACP dehydratase